MKNFGERFVEITIDRIRFVFSVEFACTIGVFLLLTKIPAIANWLNPPFDFADFNYQRYRNMEYLRIIILVLSLLAVVYGIGELVRRKFSFKSLIFSLLAHGLNPRALSP